jgi:Bacterial Ig-like domain (group 3)
MRSIFRGSGGFARRLTVLAAAAVAGAALPAAGLWAGAASAETDTTVTLTSSPNPSYYGEDVTFTAVVGGISTAEGTVTFYYGVDYEEVLCTATDVTDVDGTYEATCTTDILPGGMDSVEAIYSGYDTTYYSSMNTDTQCVRPDHTRLFTSIFFNAWQTYTVTATLIGYRGPVDDQTITFKVGDNTLCTATTNSDGEAHCNLSYDKSELIVRNEGRYIACFAGTNDYDPATAQGFGIVPS